MAIYQTGPVLIPYNWASVIGNTIDTSQLTPNSTSFFIKDTDNNYTVVTGTGFTYSAGFASVTGGTITGLSRYYNGNFLAEQISGFSISAVTFWGDLGSAKLAEVFNGSDGFELSQTQLNGANGTYALNAYGGGGLKTLSEAGVTSDLLVFQISSGISATLIDQTTAKSVALTNFNGFTGGLGPSAFSFLAQPGSALTLTSGGGTAATVQMAYALSPGPEAVLDLTNQHMSGIGQVSFHNSGSGAPEIMLDSDQFGAGGLSSSLSLDADAGSINDALDIVTTTSFDASGFTFDSNWTSNRFDRVIIDGSASSNNLTIVAPNTTSYLYGGSGSDSFTGGNREIQVTGSTGNDTIHGSTGGCFVYYGSLATPGIVAIVQLGNGTVNKGGTDGTDHLTGVTGIGGSTGNDVFYVDAYIEAVGNGGFDYVIELSTGVNVTYGIHVFQVSEFVSNTGNNTVNFSTDTGIAYLYGSTGNDTLTLGTGGGYLFGEGGTNTLTGGADATNVFEGGSGGTNTMNGGTGTAGNYYYVGSSDQVNGAGAFNEMIELAAGVTVQIGGAQYQHIQELVSNSGNNTATVASTDADFIYLYGGSGNDTLTTGSGGGYLIGEGGTNTLTGGGGLNVFVADNASGVDTMNGGSGSNVYYIDANSIVHGAGTFNTVEELQQNASLTLGSASLTGVQEVVFNGGTNLADFHTATGQVFLYGGSGSDTLFGGTGNDFLYGGLGTNTFTFATNWGKDTIEDWTAGTSDLIDLSGLSSLGVHVITDLTQTISGGKDVITSSHTGTNSITLMGVGSALAASSFHFS